MYRSQYCPFPYLKTTKVSVKFSTRTKYKFSYPITISVWYNLEIREGKMIDRELINKLEWHNLWNPIIALIDFDSTGQPGIVGVSSEKKTFIRIIWILVEFEQSWWHNSWVFSGHLSWHNYHRYRQIVRWSNLPLVLKKFQIIFVSITMRSLLV